MIEHNVIIKRFIDLKNIFKYVDNHYGKNYIREFKVNKYNVNELMR